MPDELKALVDQIGQISTEMRQYRDATDKRYDGLANDAAERAAQVVTEKVRAYQDEKLKAEAEARAANEDAILAKFDALETEVRKIGSGETKREQRDEHRDALREFITNKDSDAVRRYLPGGEKRTLSAADDTKGGFLIPESMDMEIVKGITILDPIRQYASVKPIPTGKYVFLRRTGTPTGYWVAEGTDPTASNSTYGRGTIEAHWLGAKTILTNELLADAPVAESEAVNDVQEILGYTEGIAFVSGSGVGQPMGFLTNATAIGGTITAGNFNVGAGSLVNGVDAASTIACDDFINIKNALKPQYRARGRYAMSNATFTAAQKLKDDDGHYLWRWPEGISGPDPQTINGSPFFISDYMPDNGTTLYKVLAFADWASWYTIVDAPGAEVLRDPYTSPGNLTLHWWRRTGGDIRNQEAGVILALL